MCYEQDGVLALIITHFMDEETEAVEKLLCGPQRQRGEWLGSESIDLLFLLHHPLLLPFWHILETSCWSNNFLLTQWILSTNVRLRGRSGEHRSVLRGTPPTDGSLTAVRLTEITRRTLWDQLQENAVVHFRTPAVQQDKNRCNEMSEMNNDSRNI